MRSDIVPYAGVCGVRPSITGDSIEATVVLEEG